MSKQYIEEEKKIENEVLRDLEIETIKNHLNIVFLLTIRRRGALSGYDFLQCIQDKYSVSLSPGTIYTQLYALERKRFIKGHMDSSGKRTYSLTSGGLKATDVILSSRNQIEKMFALLFEQ